MGHRSVVSEALRTEFKVTKEKRPGRDSRLKAAAERHGELSARASAAAFRAKCRQHFLSGQYFDLNRRFLRLLKDASVEAMKEGALVQEPDSSSAGGLFKNELKLLKLHYTAGCAIEEIKRSYASVIEALGEWHTTENAYSKWLAEKRNEALRIDMTPFEFEDLYQYQLTIDVVSLGILLGEGNALRQCARWMQSVRGRDLLFEFLIEPAVRDPNECTEYFHTSPYDPLIDAIYALESPQEASAKVKEYLDGWYKSFEGAPWHDGHLHAVEGEYIPYYGYWSFEAAAVCVIHDIDDSSFRDHLVYPKDLADWARANRSLERLKPGA